MRRISALIRMVGSLAPVALSAPGHAQVHASRPQLRWSSPPHCPGQAAVEAQIGSLLGADAGPLEVADVRAEGRIERIGGRYRLTLTVGKGDAASSRIIESGSCDELAGAAAVAVALLARTGSLAGAPSGGSEEGRSSARDPTPATTPRGSASPGPVATGGPAELHIPVESHAAAAAGSSPGAWRIALDVPLASANLGTLPAVGIGIGLAASARTGRWRFAAGAALWLTQTVQVPDRAGFGGEFARQSAQVSVCYAAPLGPLELGPCARVGFDRVSAHGVGPSALVPESQQASWFSGGAGVLAAWPLGSRLSLLSEASAWIPGARPQFVIDQVGEVVRLGWAAMQLDLGCEWIL